METLIAGVAALQGSPEHRLVAPLLAETLLAFHIHSGLSTAFPEARAKIAEQRAVAAARRSDKMKKEGPKLWKTLHKRALAHDSGHGILTTEEETWITKQFPLMIPCGDCKVSYAEFLQKEPPLEHIKASAYFGWTVRLHNFVNAKLGYRELTEDEARVIHSE